MTELNEQEIKGLGSNEQVRKSRSGFWLGIVILFVVVGLAAVGYYFLQSLRDQQKDISSEVKDQMFNQLNDYQAQINAMQQQIVKVSEKIDRKDEHFNKTLDNFTKSHSELLDTTRKDFSESLDKIQRQLGKTRGDWLIADAEYLLSVANERLHLIGDVHTTLEALEAADQRLRESGDTGVIKVREKIAEEISVIKNINLPDTVGMYVAIQAQQEQVSNLVLLQPFAGKKPATEKKAETGDSKDDNALLNILGVKHSEQPVEAILTAEEAEFIYQQLRVKLEMVKIALVQHNEKLYQAALTDAKKWLDKHFVDNETRQRFISELDKFNGMQTHNQLPDISISLKMLKDISKLRIEADKDAQQNTEKTESKKPVADTTTNPMPAVEPAPNKP